MKDISRSTVNWEKSKREIQRHAQVDPEIDKMRKKENARHVQVNPEIENCKRKKLQDNHTSILKSNMQKQENERHAHINSEIGKFWQHKENERLGQVDSENENAKQIRTCTSGSFNRKKRKKMKGMHRSTLKLENAK